MVEVQNHAIREARRVEGMGRGRGLEVWQLGLWNPEPRAGRAPCASSLTPILPLWKRATFP